MVGYGMKKRRIIFLVVLAIFLPIIFIAVIVGILVICFSQPRYYQKAGWKVNKEDYVQKYIPFFFDYFRKEFSNEVGITYFEEIQEENNYYFSYDDSQRNILIDFYTPTTESYCKFTSKIILYETDEFIKYGTIQAYDRVISNFGLNYFYDFPIQEGIFKDIFDEHLLSNKNHIWYTSIVGNIESSYSITCKDNVSLIELYVTALIIGFDL